MQYEQIPVQVSAHPPPKINLHGNINETVSRWHMQESKKLIL